ncbi:MAG: SDR family oxidoreductase, partial [Lysobacter sp.]
MKAALVILGATDGVGRGVVQAAIAADRPVIAVARDDRELHALRSAYRDADITVLPGTIIDDVGGAELATTLRELGRPLAGVIAVVAGNAHHGRLLDQPAEFLRRKLDETLMPHLVAARHLVPVLAKANRGASYLLIGGPGSEQPWAGHGDRSIAGAALHMLARVLHNEALALSVRVQLLSVDTPVRTDANNGCGCPQWPTARA